MNFIKNTNDKSFLFARFPFLLQYNKSVFSFFLQNIINFLTGNLNFLNIGILILLLKEISDSISYLIAAFVAIQNIIH